MTPKRRAVNHHASGLRSPRTIPPRVEPNGVPKRVGESIARRVRYDRRLVCSEGEQSGQIIGFTPGRQTTPLKRQRKVQLMIVDVLLESTTPGHDDQGNAKVEGLKHRVPAVRNNHTGGAHELGKLIGSDGFEPPSVAWNIRRCTKLNQDGFTRLGCECI